jgi:hypothetical protein
MEEKIKAALANVDRVISSVNMNRQEHLVLVQNIELLTSIGKRHVELLETERIYLKLCEDNEDKKDESTD